MGTRTITGRWAPLALVLALVLGTAAGNAWMPRPAAAAPELVSAANTQLSWEATSPEGALVTLDGSASSIDAVLYAWWETCTAMPCPDGARLSDDSIDNQIVQVQLSLGDHLITLWAADDAGEFAPSELIIVSVVTTAPVAEAGPNNNYSATSPAGASVPLNGTGSTGAESYSWSVVGSEIAVGPTPTVDLPIGTTEVTLTVTSIAGLTAADTVNITITPILPNADAGDDQSVPSPDGNPVAVTLDGGGSTNTLSYVWDLPGALPDATDVSPVVTLPVGTHTITLTATSVSGDTDTDAAVITVTGPPPPLNADAGADRTAYLTNGTTATVQLDGTASTGVVSYSWQDLDSPAAPFTQPRPTFLLREGVQTIRLTVTGVDGLTDTDDIVVTVAPEPPLTADAGPNQTVTAVNGSTADVRLDGSDSAFAVSYFWVIPGGLPDVSGERPLVTLPVGTYNISLTTTSASGATKLDSVIVTVNKPPPNATLSGPSTGPGGTELDYSFVGFANSVQVNIFFVGGGNSILAVSKIASSSGVGSGSLLVPTMTGGLKQVRFVVNGVIIDQGAFTVTPQLKITPSTAKRGDPVTIAVTGFAAAEPIKILWKINGVFVQIGSGATTGFGTAGGTLPVPMGVGLGVNTVRAEGTINAAQTSGITIIVPAPPPPPSASVTPSRAAVNTVVGYTLAAFPANATVSISLRKPSGGPVELGTVQTNASGAASGGFVLPATTGGAQQVRFVSGSVTVNAAFEVAPRIKVGTGSAGGQASVSLRGYAKGETVQIRWKVDGVYVTVGTVTTSNSGSANTTVTVPAGAAAGNNTVRGDGPVFRAQTNVAFVTVA